MPNHVTNNLTIEGPDVEKVIESLKGEGRIDFNKIVPMPERLHLNSNGTESEVERILSKIPKKYAGTPEKRQQYFKDNIEVMLDLNPEYEPYIRNYILYGYTTWYPWALEYWGTKWNAYQINGWNGDTITFQTAWSMPEPIYIALSKKFPEHEFTVEFADEDIGTNCGRVVLKEGNYLEQYFPTGDEACEFACDIWGCDPADYLESNKES